MKEIDKKRVPISNQKKNSGRPERRERKQLEHDTSHKVLGSKETDSIDCYANLDSNTVTSVSSSNEYSEVDENLVIHYMDDVNRLEQAIQYPKTSSAIKEINSKIYENVHDEEIDSETPGESVSSQGDSQVGEDEKIERASRLHNKLEKKKDTNDVHLPQASRTKSDRGMNKLQTKSSRDVPKKTQKISKASPNGNIKTVPSSNVKSIKDNLRSSSESSESVNDKLLEEVKDVDILDDENEENCDDEEKAAMVKKIEEMEMRIEKLEEELREVAALEISLYSVESNHGSSGHKVHTPARRLSRVYIQVYRNQSLEKQRATIARSIVSGLALVVKSCGKDVPRLTFWLSNIIFLRETISQFVETETFVSALENVESRIFSQLVESVWWQIFIPIMQSPVENSNQMQKQGGSYYSINLWKNAFEDALRQLCPLQAGGHECGCLPMLARIVMEQCISRLDVAMFNAILRESAHQIPTDPISDPIVDSKVLPIPAGDLSFGSGAQLKTAVGNWSIYLNDLFGIDDDSEYLLSSSGQFRLLNNLSNLLMLPKDLLTDSSTREEVCPWISLPVMKRILCNFIPDELCPDFVPGAVLEVINAECTMQRLSTSHLAITFPYVAAPVAYTSPSLTEKGVVDASSFIETNGYTSEEEEEEVDTKLPNSPTGACNECYEKAVRFELLREVWSA